MAARSQTPVQDAYGSIPHPNDPILINKGYGPRSSSRPNSWVAGSSSYPAHGTLADPSPIPHNARFREELDPTSQRASLDGSAVGMQRSASLMSRGSRSATPSRSSTLRKKSSLNKRGSVRRSGSKRSMRAGSVRSLNLGDKEKYGVDGDDSNSAFYVPIPTTGTPTDTLANRFQGMICCPSISWRELREGPVANPFYSLAQVREGAHRLLQGTSKVLRGKVQTIVLRLGCHAQHVSPAILPPVRWSFRCHRNHPGLPSSSLLGGEQSGRGGKRGHQTAHKPKK